MNTVINEERLNKRLAYLSVNHKAKLLKGQHKISCLAGD